MTTTTAIATKTQLTHVLVLNGPNLNLLGKREPEIYGFQTLQHIEDDIRQLASQYQVKLTCFQTNQESALIDKIHHHGLLTTNPHELIDAIIINPAAFTHTSVAIRDALLAVNKPFIEVHLSNIHTREPFRQHSYFSDKAEAVICGMGAFGYTAAFNYLVQKYR